MNRVTPSARLGAVATYLRELISRLREDDAVARDVRAGYVCDLEHILASMGEAADERPRPTHSKSEYKRLKACGVNAAPPAQEEQPKGCPDALLPDGPVCPRCGGPRAPSGVGGGSWVHFPHESRP